MTEHGLSQRQIFGVMRKNLEAKALKQFDEFHDEATLLEYEECTCAWRLFIFLKRTDL